MNRRLFLLFIILLFHLKLPAAEPPEQETLERLGNGEILLLDASTDEAGGSARVQALVQAPVKAVWELIVSCEQTFIFVKGLKKCEILEDKGGKALIHQVVKTSWIVPTQDFIFESLRDPYDGIRFQLVEGSLKAMEGRWQFTEGPGGLLLDYEIRIRPGMPVPAFIVSYVIRKGMPDLIACIRGLAGGSGTMERAQGDLERCQGSR
jgi:ribosome-associated toxin RatA of RatAB toxin-antitoxin module